VASWSCSALDSFSESNSRRYIQLRLEGFNVWNHVNYSGYKLGSNTVVPAATGGYSTDTKTIMNNYSSAIAVDPRLVRATGCTGIQETASVKRTRKTPETEDPARLQLAAKLYFQHYLPKKLRKDRRSRGMGVDLSMPSLKTHPPEDAMKLPVAGQLFSNFQYAVLF